MRGDDQRTEELFSYLSPERRVPADHPLRVICDLTDVALRSLSRDFARLYAMTGCPFGGAGETAAGIAAASALQRAQ